jgi:hypothetical protein
MHVGDVLDQAERLERHAGGVAGHLGASAYVPHAAGQHQPELEVTRVIVLQRGQPFSDMGAVRGVHVRHELREGHRSVRRIAVHDPVEVVRPLDGAVCTPHTPAEVAHPLGVGESCRCALVQVRADPGNHDSGAVPVYPHGVSGLAGQSGGTLRVREIDHRWRPCGEGAGVCLPHIGAGHRRIEVQRSAAEYLPRAASGEVDAVRADRGGPPVDHVAGGIEDGDEQRHRAGEHIEHLPDEGDRFVGLGCRS